MGDINNMLDRLYLELIAVIAVLVSTIKALNKTRKSIMAYFAVFFVGLLSSVFFCWLGAEITIYLTASERLGLAVGGMCAWVGADVIKSKLEALIDALISRASGDDGMINTTKDTKE